MSQAIVPNLWFDFNQAEEAAQYYIDVFGNGRVIHTAHYMENTPGPAGTVMVVEWEVNGQRFVGINGGSQFKFSEAVSFQIECDTQDEIDHYWERFIGDGGEEGPCGWCKDKYGLSWQVVPKGMDQLFSDPDQSKAQRAMQAMLKMHKIEIAALQEAADGVGAA